MTKKTIDINCDVGELDEIDDLDFIPYVSSINVCCGEHAGNPEKILAAIRAAKKYGVKVGAHPSYPDRQNFGRKSMEMEEGELAAILMEQILYIKLLCEKENVPFHHVKPHGALYHDFVNKESVKKVFLEILRYIDPEIKIYTSAQEAHVADLRNKGWNVVPEGFMDRTYEQDGSLTSRDVEGSILTDWDKVSQQLTGLLKGNLKLSSGKEMQILCDSICLHSDTTDADLWVQNIRAFLKTLDVELS
jgi:UPF0271 protein